MGDIFYCNIISCTVSTLSILSFFTCLLCVGIVVFTSTIVGSLYGILLKEILRQPFQKSLNIPSIITNTLIIYNRANCSKSSIFKVHLEGRISKILKITGQYFKK
jgi:hypothetical protein